MIWQAMLIDNDNAYQGNRAVAWVLLLYYHLLREGGITHDQTVYVDSEDFNAFEYVSVSVVPSLQSEIDQRLIRQGAVVYLLCELNDLVSDYEATVPLDYTAFQNMLQKIFATYVVQEFMALVSSTRPKLSPSEKVVATGLTLPSLKHVPRQRQHQV